MLYEVITRGNGPLNLKFKNRDYGVELDGPLIKDKLFFMIAAERVTENKPFSEGPVA